MYVIIDIILHFVGSMCPGNSVSYQDYCYFISDMTAKFTNARLECGRFPGGDLATFHSAEEFQFLVALAEYVSINKEYIALK